MSDRLKSEPFQGLCALVTGGGSGIGRSITRELALSGATVIAVGRRKETLAETAAGIDSASLRVKPHVADITVGEDILNLTARIQKDFGHLDILVHSAGTIAIAEAERASLTDLDAQYKTNVRAPYALTQSLLSMLREAQGQIVFINSSVGLKSRAGVIQYAATKHALRAIADGIREELNPDGVRVASVFVGRTASPMQMSIHELEGVEYHPEQLLQPEDVATVVVNILQVARTAEVTDISIRPLKKRDAIRKSPAGASQQ